jgi:hypothetical protein
MPERPVVDGNSNLGPEIPTRLVAHLSARYWWFGGCVALGLTLIVSGVAAHNSTSDLPETVVALGLGVGVLAAGSNALRIGVVADQDAVTITNIHTHTIPWADLEDITLIRLGGGVEIDLGERFMLFTSSREGRSVVAAAPSGWNKPGRRLPRLQHDLLTMRDRYKSPSP